MLLIVMPAGFAANNTTNATPYTISTLDSHVGADVTKNPEIASTTNIPRTDLANQILEKEKQGSAVLQFGNGSGNKLLIWAGIHGNEEEANIATMQYLEYIKNTNFSGTLYVVPFAIPKDTSLNSRYYGPMKYTYTVKVKYKKVWYKKAYTKWYKKVYRYHGKKHYKWVKKTYYKKTYKWLYKYVKKTGYKYVDPNRVANVQGTPGWNVVQFAKNHGITNILDVHSGGGLTSYTKGVIYATTPTAASSYSGESKWANYVKSVTGCEVEYGSGQNGMVRNQGHNYGISTITLEVERDSGTTAGYAAVELKMIKAACKFFGFPG
ncbi:hypothetical protein DSECCO2_140440 [anaerobic digester metagenome]